MGETSRRRFLGQGAALLGAVLVGGCTDSANEGDAAGPNAEGPSAAGPDDGTTGPSTANTDTLLRAGDLDLLTAAAQIEQTLAGGDVALLDARGSDLDALGARATVEAQLRHHERTARDLASIVVAGGGEVVDRDGRFGGVVLLDELTLADLPIGPVTRHFRDLEDGATQTYLTMVPRLTTGPLRALALRLATTGARHVTGLDLLVTAGAPGYDPSSIIAGRYPTEDSYLLG